MAHVRPTLTQCERCGIDTPVSLSGPVPRFCALDRKAFKADQMRQYRATPEGTSATAAQQRRYLATIEGFAAHAAAQHRWGMTPEGRVSHAARDARRRARKWGAGYEPFTHADVFDRDGWRCGICSESVDPTLKLPARLSASLDHIVPLSKGGAHTLANVQLAHLACNMQKGATLAAEVA